MMTDILQYPLAQYYFSALLAAFPMARIFIRAGFPFWNSGFLFVPFLGFILCLAILAFGKWYPAKGDSRVS